MKVRVYDSGKKWAYDRYDMYFPYPKRMREQISKEHGRIIMGTYISFGISVRDHGQYDCNTLYPTNDCSMTLYSWGEDDRTIGCDIPSAERKVKIETLPKVVQDYARKMEGLWNDALKYNDDEHWKLWNEA